MAGFLGSCDVEPWIMFLPVDCKRDISDSLISEMSRLLLRKMNEPYGNRPDMTRPSV